MKQLNFMKIVRTCIAALLVAGFWAAEAPAQFTAGRLVVSQVGDGTTSLNSSNAAQVSLKEFSIDGTPGYSMTLPATGPGRKLTLRGLVGVDGEGILARSADGRFLTLSGYDAAAGTANPHTQSSATVNRTIGRIDHNGALNLTTAISDPLLVGGTARGVVSNDGNQFWMNDGGGLHYVSLGGGDLQHLAAQGSSGGLTGVEIVNGNLYVSKPQTTSGGMYKVGDGLPTTGSQALQLLPGTNALPEQPRLGDFYFADSETLYIADYGVVDTSPFPFSSGGIQKWTFDGAAWNLAYNFTSFTTPGNSGIAALTGMTDAQGITTLFAIDMTGAAVTGRNRLLAITDTGQNSTFVTLATADNRYRFRGIDWAPVPEPTTSAFMILGALAILRRRRANPRCN